MVKKNVLESKMKLHGDLQIDLAEAIGTSVVAFNYKLNGKREFTPTEIQKIRERYNLTDDEVMIIFFDRDVSCQGTRDHEC